MGKKFIFFLAVLSINLSLYSQDAVRPVDLVKDATLQGKNFQKISLTSLSENHERVTELTRDEVPHLVLDLNEASIAEIVSDAPDQFTLSIPSLNNEVLEIDLVKVDLVSDDFKLVVTSTNSAVDVEIGAHYRGIIKNDEHSIAAISIFRGELMGLISSHDGNLVLGKLEGDAWKDAEHVLYDDLNVLQNFDLDCGTKDDDHDGYTREELEFDNFGRALSDCVRFYYEVDKDIHDNKGGVSGATNYVTGLGNQVATLYANENINTEISEIKVINTSSPYNGSSSSQMLNQFQANTNNWNGDLGQLLSYKASGGIAAGFSGICNSNEEESMSFSSIQSSYSTVPTYSWSVMVVTHEFGHTFGSRHTHACVWNGNNTAIDGCAGQTEGFCSLPGYPSQGGTIMSYCHLQSVGINFNEGFGPQPGNVIRNNVSNGNCLNACGGGGGGGGSCSDNELTLTINLDNYPGETTWDVQTSGGSVLASGGSYSGAGSTVTEDLCIPDGCELVFTIYDSYGDGICCGYGNGSYSLSGPNGTIASGGAFNSSESTTFDLGSGCGGGGSCTEIDFSSYTVNSYGGSQDNGTSSLYNGGQGVILNGNAWKAIALDYTITPNTVIEFDFGSTSQGEIHGIGFDNNNGISSGFTFQLYGTQNWGNRDFDYTSPGNWQSFIIPIGSYYTGSFDRLFFVNDKDAGSANNNSYFRNIKIHEGGGCGSALVSENESLFITQGNNTNFNVYPNPAKAELNVDFNMEFSQEANIKVFNLMGQLIELRQVEADGFISEQFNTSKLPAGTYIIQIDLGDRQLMKKFNVVH